MGFWSLLLGKTVTHPTKDEVMCIVYGCKEGATVKILQEKFFLWYDVDGESALNLGNIPVYLELLVKEGLVTNSLNTSGEAIYSRPATPKGNVPPKVIAEAEE